MNGQIILNGKSYNSSGRPSREITMAEYLALPSSKYTDGIVYYIKDVGGANQFPPLIYSDEEREVGVWRDGKPLYQKSISLAGISIATGQYAIVYTQANIELKYANGCFIEGNYVYTVPEPSLRIRQDGNNIVFRAMEPSAWDISGGFLTIRYTKTTDVAGQGEWTTDGTYAKHYSTSEKVIGTWIDGKPLYEKTYTNLSVSCSRDTYTHSGIIISDMDSVVRVPLAIDSNKQSVGLEIGIYTSNKELALYVTSNPVTLVSFTIQYTKTTD